MCGNMFSKENEEKCVFTNVKKINNMFRLNYIVLPYKEKKLVP